MARMARLYVPGCSHHVIQRGNNRCRCFQAETDFLVYLDILTDAASTHDVAIHAFVLMPNHVHLLLTPTHSQSCSRMMQSLGRRYVRYFNDRHGRTGTLWEGRYRSTLVDSDNYFFTVSRYIELNRVRAKLVRHPVDYPWSSYQGNALGRPWETLIPHDLYLRLGSTPTERQNHYEQLFEHDIAPDILELLRDATNRSWAFGTDEFCAQISSEANRRVSSRGWGGNRRSK